jgi:hypothetical protein
MTKNSAKITALKKLGKKSFQLGDPLEILQEILHSSDRALAIGYVALIEDVLKSEIIRHMPHLSSTDINNIFGRNAPLFTFSAKTIIGYAMKIFGSEIRSDLDTVKEIRNTFAHCIAGLSFQTPDIAEACELLAYPQKAQLQDTLPPYPFGS